MKQNLRGILLSLMILCALVFTKNVTAQALDAKHPTCASIVLLPVYGKNDPGLLRGPAPATLHDLSKEDHLTLWVNGEEVKLERAYVFTDDFRMWVDDRQVRDLEYRSDCFRGKIEGVPDSRVALTLSRGRMQAMLLKPGHPTRFLHPGKRGSREYFLSEESPGSGDINCLSPQSPVDYDPQVLLNQRQYRASAIQVRAYLESDQSLTNALGDTNTAAAWITHLFNQVALLYQAEGVDLQLSGLRLRTNPALYNPTQVFSSLSQFGFNLGTLSNMNADVGQLLMYNGSAEPEGYAQTINGICSSLLQDRLSASTFPLSVANVPTYSHAVFVLAHEWGHTFGSRHTHACVWNGDNTAIDGCGIIEGNCPVPLNLPDGGTIMSYCSRSGSGTVVDFTKGFGYQPGNVIRHSLGTCASLPQVIQCQKKVALYPYAESFEEVYTPWLTNYPGGEWLRVRDSLSAYSGDYMLKSGFSGQPPGTEAILESPCFILGSLSEPRFSFRYRLKSGQVGDSLWLEASSDGLSWTALRAYSGENGNNWTSSFSDLTPWKNPFSFLHLRIRVKKGGGAAAFEIDQLRLEDKATIENCEVLPADFYHESFETGFARWFQGPNENLDWLVGEGDVAPGIPGPDSAFDGQKYIYVDARPQAYDELAAIYSPCFDLSGLSGVMLRLRWFREGQDMGTLNIQVSEKGSGTWSSLKFLGSSTATTGWQLEEFDLSAWSGKVLRFRVVARTGQGPESLTALDDFRVLALSAAKPEVLAHESWAPRLELYPNPSQEWLKLKLGSEAVAGAKLEVYDLNGRRQEGVRLQRDLDQGLLMLNVENLRPGMFFLRFEYLERREVLSFIKK